MKNFLQIENISKQFERHKALDEVSFGVEQGKIFGLLGPNGAGKTTLIRIINRIFAPDTGDVYINKEPLQPAHIIQMGYLPEERGLYKKMKVGEQILYFAQLKGLSRTEALGQANFWLERLEAKGWWNKKIEELSKGMQQKIQFMITVLHRPKLLILDEPFSGLDPINADLIKKHIMWLKQQGTTIIFSTHNMASVEEICEDIVLLNDSKVVLTGNLEKIKRHFSTNTFYVAFSDLHYDALEKNNFHFEQIEDKNENLAFTVKLHNSQTKDFLNFASNYGNILKFYEIRPSLHEIFIKVITDINLANT